MFLRLLTLASLLLCAVLSGSTEEQTTPFEGAKTVDIVARAIDVGAIPHAKALRPVRGWSLTSSDSDFGGLSALSVGNHGLAAISDTGLLVSLARDLSRANLQSLPRSCVPHQLQRERDSESLARDSATGMVWIGFEYRNMI